MTGLSGGQYLGSVHRRFGARRREFCAGGRVFHSLSFPFLSPIILPFSSPPPASSNHHIFPSPFTPPIPLTSTDETRSVVAFPFCESGQSPICPPALGLSGWRARAGLVASIPTPTIHYPGFHPSPLPTHSTTALVRRTQWLPLPSFISSRDCSQMRDDISAPGASLRYLVQLAAVTI